jgi:hypothetical protein
MHGSGRMPVGFAIGKRVLLQISLHWAVEGSENTSRVVFISVLGQRKFQCDVEGRT